MRIFYTHLAACLALTSAVALGWATSGLAGDTAPASPGKNLILAAAKESPSPGKTPEDAAAKIDKQLAALQEQFTALSLEESQTLIKTLMAKKTAMDSAKIVDTNKVRDEIAKGKPKPEWREYRQVLTASAQQWEALAQKFARLSAQLKPLELDRDKASPDAQAQIDTIGKRLADKRRSLSEHAGNCYYDAAEFKNALQVYLGIIQLTPENKRDRGMKEKLGDLYERSGDFKNAMALYKGIFDSIPEKDRLTDRKLVDKVVGLCEKIGDFRTAAVLYQGIWTALPEKDRGVDKNFGEKFGDLCDKAGDPKTALDIYRLTYEKIPADKQAKDGAGLKKKIAALEAKFGVRNPPPQK